MLKIGEFSRLSQVTVKALHHYDDLGLIRPVHIDPETGYRYYTVEQLPRVHRIVALKELGLSLEQIGLLFEEGVPTEQIRGMLRLRQNEIQHSLRKEQRRLVMVDFRLRMIEAEINFPELDVVMKRLEPMRVLAMLVGQHHDMGAVVKEVRKAKANGRIKFTGVSLDLLSNEGLGYEISPAKSRHEMILEVNEEQTDAVQLGDQGVMVLREEPGIEAAATLILHGGEQAARHEKVALLQRWAVAHGYALAACCGSATITAPWKRWIGLSG